MDDQSPHKLQLKLNLQPQLRAQVVNGNKYGSARW